jgi:DNA-binding transcriptional regulator YiaG
MSPEQIKRLRKGLGLTQEKFAELLHADRVTVARWETGVTKPMWVFVRLMRELEGKAKGRARR